MTDNVIEVTKLTKKFGELTAVSDLTMRIPKGVVYGFLGPNGSGKTTAIRAMCGLLEATDGEISILDMRMPQQAEAIRAEIGYMTQKFSMYEDLTLFENLKFLCQIHGMKRKERLKRIDEVTEEFNLSQFRDSLIGPMSGGQKRRIALAAALLNQPQLLILDEPTSEVDPNTRIDIFDKLFELAGQGKTVLVSTHLMDEAERCHYLTIMNHGKKVADGRTQELKAGLDAQVLSISGSNVHQLTQKLLQQKAVLQVMQSGISLRVMLDPDVKDANNYLGRLAGDEFQVKTEDKKIEDVFVRATRSKPS